ncbi:hypothetical protein MPH_12957 [Macrophomina phaseolina MS6]|uniref:Uncharacterized protein n=1 Tax=Macrophomina phaseolina (strain MS6) TaxID=1126212 RepID=K2R6S2_MACPH|nr:hypothetical protein MPH_12957 [Macrophomina phaseolina MS6]
MASIEDRVREVMDKITAKTDDREPSRLKESIQGFVSSLDDSQLSLYLMWCNARVLSKLCVHWEYSKIAARALLRLEEEKRIAILGHWQQAGEDQPPYQEGIRCLSGFNEDKMKEWNPEGTELEIPDEYVYLDSLPHEFPELAKKCVFCGLAYHKGQLVYRTDCNYGHTFHETCEMKDNREKGIVEGICSNCNGGGYQSRDELASELRRGLLEEDEHHGSQPQ